MGRSVGRRSIKSRLFSRNMETDDRAVSEGGQSAAGDKDGNDESLPDLRAGDTIKFRGAAFRVVVVNDKIIILQPVNGLEDGPELLAFALRS